MFFRVFIVFLFMCCAVHAQYSPSGGTYPDAVFDENIKTARIYKDGWETSYPIAHIDDREPLLLTFDELSSRAKNYSYTFVHCDADWRRSRLSVNEYMKGFPTNRINNYDYSFNTLVPYVHYRLTIPNEDVQLKVSGNYVITVFEDGEEDRPVLCLRFYIAESQVSISAAAVRARLTAYRDAWQQVDFTVQTVNYPIENAHQDVKPVILKNGNRHTALTGLRPLFINRGEIDYRHEKATLFSAGNEFRPLDIKSTRYSSTRMKAIEFERSAYHFYPHIDEPRNTGRYLYYEDFNGNYAVQAEKTSRPETEADYVYVHFALRVPQALDDGQIYISGAFCNYAYSPNNLMTYNPEKHLYEAVIQLKQGYYNYEYVFIPFEKPVADDVLLEGSFYDTENDYIILIYHRGRSSRYDRLVGVNVVNTLNK